MDLLDIQLKILIKGKAYLSLAETTPDKELANEYLIKAKLCSDLSRELEDLKKAS